MGLLFISFDNPDPDADEDNKHFFWGFNCGGNEAAMALWECMRSYMEIGPQALPQGNDFEGGKSSLKQRGIIWGTCFDYAHSFWLHVRAAEMGQAASLIFGIFVFGSPIIYILHYLKLSPPPDLTHPDIIEWSKPLPPEQFRAGRALKVRWRPRLNEGDKSSCRHVALKDPKWFLEACFCPLRWHRSGLLFRQR